MNVNKEEGWLFIIYIFNYQSYIDRAIKNKTRFKMKRVSIIYVIKSYMCCSIFFTKLPFGCAPTNLSTTWPFFTKRIAGIEVIP